MKNPGRPTTQSGGRVDRVRTTRHAIYLLNRILVCGIVGLFFGTLLVRPSSLWLYGLDVAFRTYLMFLGSVMAHEAVHGHLGRTRASNFLWGRISLLPTMVPFTNFRKTHQLHHAHTNVPEMDPDHFMKPGHSWEIPFRALAMPHQWFFWLRKRGRLKAEDLKELLFNYGVILLIYASLLPLVGLSRFLWGMLPALVLVSMLLWYPFALKTHEGFSMGAPEMRSHDYYGSGIYWFSLGLSMHRKHHLEPRLSWIELREFVEKMPAGRLFPCTDRRVKDVPERPAGEPECKEERGAS